MKVNKMASRRQWNIKEKWITLWLFLPPVLMLFTFFVILPMIEASYYSFFRWNGFGALNRFIGFKNYHYLLTDPIFYRSLMNSMLIIVVSLLIQLPLALLAALLIYKNHWSNTVFRLIFFLPFMLAEIATGMIWRFIYDGQNGAFATINRWFNQDGYQILGDSQWAFSAILITIVWKYFGFHMMIYIAGLQNINNEVLEASVMDGASPIKQVFHIKIPLIYSSIALSIFFSVLGALQAFDLIIALTGGGPSHRTHSLVSYLYEFGLVRRKIGYGSSIGVVLFIFSISFALIYQRYALRRDR